MNAPKMISVGDRKSSADYPPCLTQLRLGRVTADLFFVNGLYIKVIFLCVLGGLA